VHRSRPATGGALGTRVSDHRMSDSTAFRCRHNENVALSNSAEGTSGSSHQPRAFRCAYAHPLTSPPRPARAGLCDWRSDSSCWACRSFVGSWHNGDSEEMMQIGCRLDADLWIVQSSNMALFEVRTPCNSIKAGSRVELPRHQPVTKSVARVSARAPLALDVRRLSQALSCDRL